MKSLFGKLLLLTFVSAGLLLMSAPHASAQGVNNFKIQTYKIDYYLGRDAENRSTLKTIEVITAEFPLENQNHGIERSIPKSYDGHSTSLKIESVTDTNGKELNYTTYESNGNEVVRIGDADTYVHGLQNYRIIYSQRDVTRYFDNTKSDEFYWDTNGTGWAVPIALLSARVHFDKDLYQKLNGNRNCYVGTEGSNQFCELLANQTGDGYTAAGSALRPYENITVAFGFPAGTFAPYKMSLADKLAAYAKLMAALSFPLGVLAAIILSIRYYRASNRISERTTIVPEYLPPQEASVSTAATILNQHTASFSAQLIDFAVRHYTKIYQVREKTWYRKAEYEIEIIKDISTLKDEEQEIFRDIFPTTAVGTRLNMKSLRNNTAVALKVSDNKTKLDKKIEGTYGLRGRNPAQARWFRRAALILLLLALPLLSFWVAAAALLSFILSFTIRPLTDKGLALWHYLQGLKMYIKTAETDRLKMLQSPDGALKLDASIDTTDTAQLVKLYEKVLPYAILFGLEKDWNKQLGQYYESLKQAPDWYAGNHAVFNAAVLSSAIGDFKTTASYTSASSSSSGGSSGGGSSGGGGGGGGGGGW